MRRSVLGMAILPGVLACTGAAAQSSVTIYGIIDQGVNYISNAQALDASGHRVGRTQYTTSSTVMAGNQLGFRGVEDLGQGYKAIFTLETGFDIGTGKFRKAEHFLAGKALWVWVRPMER